MGWVTKLVPPGISNPTWFAFAFYTEIVSSGVHRTNTLAARGLEELFSSCAVVSVFGSGGK